MTIGALTRSTLRTTAATYFLLAADVKLVLDGPPDSKSSGDVTPPAAKQFNFFDEDGNAPTPPAPPLGLYSQGAARRHRRLAEIREGLLEHQRRHIARSGSWWYVARSTLLSWMVHGPLGSVLTRSLTVSHSMRALHLCMQLLGMLMLATVFCQASGGALAKDSDEACEFDCAEGGVDVATCIQMYVGRLLAIGLVSALVAGIPVTVITSMHARQFVHVPYEGSPEWHKCLKKWWRADMAVWVIGLAYCGFAVNFIVLFFANVAAQDQEDWMISASISFSQEFIIVPVSIGFVISLMCLILLAVTACRTGIKRRDFTMHGSIDHIRDIFKTTTDNNDNNGISQLLAGQDGNAALMQPELMQSWRGLELSMYHDVGLVDPGMLQLRTTGLGAA
jgi:hypothetical protein